MASEVEEVEVEVEAAAAVSEVVVAAVQMGR